ncbi:hypothetical protein ACWGIU_18005 [Streptomyces sp. NPDC054840]
MTTVLPERPVVAEPGKVRTWLRRIWGGGADRRVVSVVVHGPALE